MSLLGICQRGISETGAIMKGHSTIHFNPGRPVLEFQVDVGIIPPRTGRLLIHCIWLMLSLRIFYLFEYLSPLSPPLPDVKLMQQISQVCRLLFLLIPQLLSPGRI